MIVSTQDIPLATIVHVFTIFVAVWLARCDDLDYWNNAIQGAYYTSGCILNNCNSYMYVHGPQKRL